jgi:hypothetical protein
MSTAARNGGADCRASERCALIDRFEIVYGRDFLVVGNAILALGSGLNQGLLEEEKSLDDGDGHHGH